ncbi:hypothetical protein, partial [Arthrobacter sp. H41]|uniref:hypothetical protein n=1 Tax=Arthrobacter sp. H41 TaxID=1312978 RepID=UPI00047CA047
MAATAHDDDDRRSHRSWTVTVEEETELATGLVGPLRVAVGRGSTAYVSQNFIGQLTELDRGDEPVTLVDKPGIEIGGVSTDKGRIYFTESVGGPGVTDPPVANLNVHKRGEVSLLADLNKYEMANDPDKGAAYGLQNVDDGCLALVPEALAPSARPHGGEVYSHPYA